MGNAAATPLDMALSNLARHNVMRASMADVRAAGIEKWMKNNPQPPLPTLPPHWNGWLHHA
eukprot:382577-Prorocentrum_lima.AAC.1